MFDLVKIGPKKDDSVIINGMFLLRYSTVPLRHTLRGLVRHILIKALKMSEHRLDFVLNTKKVFIALLIMNVFVYSVMKKECYRWRMFMTHMVLTMNLIHVLLFMQYTLNN